MSLSGVHIVFAQAAYAGGPASLPLGNQASDTMASPGTSSVKAPGNGLALLSINASAAIYYAVGPNPNPTSGPRRYYDPAINPREDVFCNAGDAFAWAAA